MYRGEDRRLAKSSTTVFRYQYSRVVLSTTVRTEYCHNCSMIVVIVPRNILESYYIYKYNCTWYRNVVCWDGYNFTPGTMVLVLVLRVQYFDGNATVLPVLYQVQVFVLPRLHCATCYYSTVLGADGRLG